MLRRLPCSSLQCGYILLGRYGFGSGFGFEVAGASAAVSVHTGLLSRCRPRATMLSGRFRSRLRSRNPMKGAQARWDLWPPWREGGAARASDVIAHLFATSGRYELTLTLRGLCTCVADDKRVLRVLFDRLVW